MAVHCRIALGPHNTLWLARRVSRAVAHPFDAERLGVGDVHVTAALHVDARVGHPRPGWGAIERGKSAVGGFVSLHADRLTLGLWAFVTASQRHWRDFMSVKVRSTSAENGCTDVHLPRGLPTGQRAVNLGDPVRELVRCLTGHCAGGLRYCVTRRQ